MLAMYPSLIGLIFKTRTLDSDSESVSDSKPLELESRSKWTRTVVDQSVPVSTGVELDGFSVVVAAASVGMVERRGGGVRREGVG